MIVFEQMEAASCTKLGRHDSLIMSSEMGNALKTTFVREMLRTADRGCCSDEKH